MRKAALAATLLILAALLQQQPVDVVTLDSERADVTFLSRAHADGMGMLLALDADQQIIFDDAVNDASQQVEWCDQFFLSSISWTLRWTNELSWRGHGPRPLTGMPLEESPLWRARRELQEELFQTLEALRPGEAEALGIVWASRQRVLANRDGYPPVACPDLVDVLLKVAPLALKESEGDWVQHYTQRADELTRHRTHLFESELPILRRDLERGRLDIEQYKRFYLEMARNAAEFRALVRETAGELLRSGVIDNEKHSVIINAMYPSRMDRYETALSSILGEAAMTHDEREQRRLRQVAEAISVACKERWALLRLAYDHAYEDDAIEAWANGMAEQLQGGPQPDFHRAVQQAKEATIISLDPALEVEIKRQEQAHLAARNQRPIDLHGDEFDVLRDVLNEAEASIGLRFAWFLPDVLEEHGLLDHPELATILDEYIGEVTVLAGRFQEVAPRYAELTESEDPDADRHLLQATIDLCAIVRSFDELNRQALEELAEHGQGSIRDRAIEAAFEPVFRPSPVHRLVEKLLASSGRLTDEERATVEEIFREYSESEEEIRKQLVQALAGWDSLERTIGRIHEANRQGRLRAWRVWNEGSHPSIRFWQEQTDLARRTWKELSGLIAEPRRSELPIPLQMALKLGDGV